MRSHSDVATALRVLIAGAVMGAMGCVASEPSVTATDGGLDATAGDASRQDAALTTDASNDGAGGADAEGGEAGCGVGTKACFNACVAQEPATGCGAATCTACNVANAIAACSSSGACIIGTCNAGFADCNQDASDGCETDLSLPAHCGACGTTCTAAAPYCAQGMGGFACATDCPATAPTLCSGTCVDVTSDPQHCGSCGMACPASGGTATCAGSTCGFTCATGTHACANACENDDDPSHCGPSCTQCPTTGANVAGATCTSNACNVACDVGHADCAGTHTACSTSTASDPLNCGTCTNSCNGGSCMAGHCGCVPCVLGTATLGSCCVN